MTGIRELSRDQIVSAEAEHVRVSVFGDRTQLDIAIPLDIPIASYLPELAQLVLSRGSSNDADANSRESRKNHWVLRHVDSNTPLPANSSLRSNKIKNGSQLVLSSERTLSAPTLYDDVVDAAARLNRSSYAPWDATTARNMALAGVNLVALVLTSFLISMPLSGQLAAVCLLCIFTVGTLLAGAAVAYRSFRNAVVASSFLWACIPVSTAVSWVSLKDLGEFGIAGTCLAMLAFNYSAYRLVGTGLWGILAATVVFALCGTTALTQALLHPRIEITGTVLTLGATLLLLTVPKLVSPLDQFKAPTMEIESADEAELFENPFNQQPNGDPIRSEGSVESLPTAESVRQRVELASLVRSSLYTGLIVTAGIGLNVTIHPTTETNWKTLVFGFAILGVIALRIRDRLTKLERYSITIPTLISFLAMCITAQFGTAVDALIAYGATTGIAVTVALVEAFAGNSWKKSTKVSAALTYVDYILVASLIPLSLWVLDSYRHFGSIRW
ncbi:type VII secretion integral membrane protein EccD [Mycobacteroides abscessus]|uniref:type VII secretion integral membrane protein EccD n=1 Tax=Mycobacteroides abscessus TaxID=36809 RepID=UPI0009288FCD|nr:type VII secretion integral membrane protein EccD [Mycobacteroides abscessus]MBN7483444.1 type VII secretion integral membrane protein EccD [Mycobacteroides abscessus subsp. massiliense]MDO3103889.1 type VII secretion integral membrane protein EccD [Mycobacteroides abscessus subsp. abscessus]MDO3338754.1 type VII secretion integral membrane protein EccD [Mycobacteroides abscessus subsp. abscessus]QOF27075.1 type VII secretion integral membrane protein EccD [Mycobacteroides abscessus]RIQ9725